MNHLKTLPAQQARHYETLLRDAKRIQGVSLSRDAWRRLKKNSMAMVSLWGLAFLGLATLFTPLIPLQSPQIQHLGNLQTGIPSRQFLPPNRSPVRLAIDGGGGDSHSPMESLKQFDEEIAQLRSRLKHGATDELIGELATATQTKNPIAKIWYEPGRFDQILIRIRLAIFGDWCIPSVFGTDHLGRDILSRLMWGGRVSMAVGIVAALVSLVIGVTYGAVAGFLGGWVDDVMMRFVDVLYSIPFIFLVIFIITILGEPEMKERLENFGIDQIMVFFLVIGAIYWLTMARVVRGQVVSLKNEQFVEAARTGGATRRRIIFRHLLPNLMSVVIVYLTLTIPSVMLFEAFLSFLGLGVEPPNVSWGLLANDGIQVITPVQIYWWLVLFPGLALALTLFALNFLGDGLRDALSPRMKNR